MLQLSFKTFYYKLKLFKCWFYVELEKNIESQDTKNLISIQEQNKNSEGHQTNLSEVKSDSSSNKESLKK